METTPTPEILPMVPQEMKDRTQWILWSYDEKGDKIPKNPRTLGNAMVNQPPTWSTYEKAVEVGSKYNLGLGFVLTEADPYTCIDLDDCLGRGGVRTEPAASIVNTFRGNAYIEASPSRMGLHIWVRNQLPVNRRTPGIEIYSSGRWMTVSGHVNPNAPHIVEIPDATEMVQWLIAQYFTKEAPPAPPSASYEVLEHDRQIWERLFNSKNGATFKALFNGDLSHTHNDHSRGVIFLANILAQMTDGDAGRMKTLLYQTGLVNEKWDRKLGGSTWLDYMINDAIEWSRKRRR